MNQSKEKGDDTSSSQKLQRLKSQNIRIWLTPTANKPSLSLSLLSLTLTLSLSP